MSSLHTPRRTAAPALAAAIGLLAACSAQPESPTASAQPVALAQAAEAAHAAHARLNNGELTPAQKQAIAQVRNATARFHDIAVAKDAMYNEQFPPGCAQSSEGAQAFHYIDRGLVDEKVELLRPELLMYEPGPGGSLQLIGVDYVVPLEASTEAPTLLGVPFMRNEPLGVWALHIWAWRPNPSGMFAAWNPKVSCEHAP